MPREQTIYESVTSRIIAELEAGRLPWVQPWGVSGASLGMPRNGLTGNGYSGINVLILWDALIQKGYGAQCWLTFKQALALGGAVRKGEHGTTVVYADSFTPKAERDKAESSGDDPAQVAFLKRYTVFNHAQCELPQGAPIHGLPKMHDETPIDAHRHGDEPATLQAQRFMRSIGADVRTGGDRAFYAPSLDYIQMPELAAFISAEDYFATVVHECGHWSGAPHRLNRDLRRHGSEAIAREELIAELTSAFLCATFGIEPTVRHADYVGSWLHVLRGDNRAIFQAASMASKAATYLLAFENGVQPSTRAAPSELAVAA